MRDETKLLNAKRQLYAALLDLDYDEWTDAEANIGAALLRDEQVQAWIDTLFQK